MAYTGYNFSQVYKPKRDENITNTQHLKQPAGIKRQNFIRPVLLCDDTIRDLDGPKSVRVIFPKETVTYSLGTSILDWPRRQLQVQDVYSRRFYYA